MLIILPLRPLRAAQLLQHLPRRAQTPTIPINRRDQAPIDLWKLALKNLLIFLIFRLRPRRLIALHDFNLMAAILTLGKRCFRGGFRAAGRETGWNVAVKALGVGEGVGWRWSGGWIVGLLLGKRVGGVGRLLG